VVTNTPGPTAAQTIAGPAQGIYRGLPFAEYLSLDAVNSHLLNAFSRTPAHVLYELQHGGPERTPSLDLGWLFHWFVLEPERFGRDIVVTPNFGDKRLKANKQKWIEFEAAHAGAQFIDSRRNDELIAMRDSLFAHPVAGPFFNGRGHNEVSILWDDTEHGLRCKARIDRVGFVNEWPIVGDLKSARDASRRAFERAIYNFGYYIQAVHYLSGLEAVVPIPEGNPFRRFIFFVVESEPPYLTACYELDDLALNEGAIARNRYMRTYRQCIETGEWPGYPAGIDYVSLPPWAFKAYIDD